MTDQELADALQDAIWKTNKLAQKALKRACEAAETSESAAHVVPHVAKVASAILLAHGEATQAANLMPDVTPSFGSK